MLIHRLLAASLLLTGSYSYLQAAESAETVAGFRIGPRTPSDAELYLHSDGSFYGSSTAGGAEGMGTLFRLTADGGLDWMSFSDVGGSAPGRGPQSPLVRSTDGWLWGTTEKGGVMEVDGTVFRYKPETGEHQVILDFANNASSPFLGTLPGEGLSPDGTGWLWGSTPRGGEGSGTGDGVVFRVNEGTGIYESIIGNEDREWSNTAGSFKGRYPGAVYADPASNFVWGTTTGGGVGIGGTVFRIDRTNLAFVTVGEFSTNGTAGTIPGNAIKGRLTPDGLGFLWGVTTNANGSLFKVNMAGTDSTATTSQVIFTGNTGANLGKTPVGSLIRGADGLLWGVTKGGGSNDKGTVFKLDPASGILTTVVQFGLLSGEAAAVSNPLNPLTADGEGYVWGLAQASGSSSWTFYKVQMSTGTVSLVGQYTEAEVTTHGKTPLAGLIGTEAGPWLYGTASVGGKFGFGTLYRYNTLTRALETLVDFTGTSGAAMGAEPQARLHVHTDGTLWGVTRLGGAGNFGTVFKYDPATTTFTHVAAFTAGSGNNRGAFPSGKLVTGADGFIWGMTTNGQNGTIFKINPATGVLTGFKTFVGSNSPDGYQPLGGLAADSNGLLWGMTSRGGGPSGVGSGNGTIFNINPLTSAFTSVIQFTGDAGAYPGQAPAGDPVFDEEGHLWGRTTASSAAGVFKFNPANNVLAYVPAQESATYPPELEAAGSLYVHTDGFKYGVVSNGGVDAEGEAAGGGYIYRLVEGYPSATTTVPNPAASAPYPTSVSLGGSSDLNGSAGTRQFEWGSTSGLGQVTPALDVTQGSPASVFTQILPELSSETSYYFRARVNGPNGPVYGNIETLLTRPVNAASGTSEIFVESPLGQPLVDGVSTANLGAVQVGEQAVQAVIIRNIGQYGLEDLTATVIGTDEGKFVITKELTPVSLSGMGTTLPVSIPSAYLFITYTPGEEGTHEALLTLTSTDSNEDSFEISLTGSGLVDPDIQVEQPTDTVLASDGSSIVDFGSSAVGVAADSLDFVVRNVGLGSLNEVVVSLSGPNKDDFSLLAEPGASIAASGSDTLTIGFTPSGNGTRTATLTITSSDPDEDIYQISLTGSGSGAAEIVVEQPVGTNVNSGGSVFFGSVTQGSSVDRTITIRNTGTGPLTLSASILGQDQYEITSSPAGTIQPDSSTTMVVTLTPLSPLPVIATLRLLTNDSDEDTFDIILNGSGATQTNPVFAPTGQPQSRIALIGQPTSFVPVVTGNDPKTYQWMKNGKNIAGNAAKELGYTIENVKSGDAGTYSLTVSNDTPPAATSDDIHLGTVTPLPATYGVKEGATLTLGVKATAPPGFTLSYLWKREGLPLSTSDARITGEDDKTLKIKGILPAEDGTYTCEVTMTPASGAPIVGTAGDCEVSILERPVLSAIASPAPTLVSETVPLSPLTTVGGMFAKFSAKGLPPGVKLDSTTGVFTGKPTTAKTYTVTFTALNAAGKSDPVTITWVVNPLTSLDGVVGTFQGVIERHTPTNAGLGGFVQITTTSKGAISGSITLGGKKYPFKGALDTSTGDDTTATLIAKRPASLGNLEVSLSIETGSDRLTGTIAEEGSMDEAPFSAHRNVWTKINAPAEELVAKYTAGIVTTQTGNPLFPQGDGYATLSVSKTGAAKWVGKTADGAAFTFSTIMGPDEEVILHALLYKKTGSLQGLTYIDDANGDWFSVEIPPFDWYKQEQPEKSKDRLYKDGFAPHNVDLIGGRYEPVNNLFEFLDIAGGNSPRLVVENTVPAFELPLTITAPNKVALLDNPRKMKLAIKAATGIYTGSFTEGTPARKAAISGVLVRNTAGSILRGYGYFTIPATTDKTSPILSTKARIEMAD